MRIGIITYWATNDNYGQQLQCWALQQILIKFGHEPFLIKYDPYTKPPQKEKKSFIRRLSRYLLIYPLFLNVYSRYRKNKRIKNNEKRRFVDFRNNNILSTNVVYHSLAELQSAPPEADCYLSGSDQVFAALVNNRENHTYFLDFGDESIIRVSYAASFGRKEYPKELRNELFRLLSRFRVLLVREKSGIDICKEIGLSAKVVLDPTLLLNMNDYMNKLVGTSFNISSKYIYIYSINIRNKNEVEWNEITKFAKANSCKILITTASGYFQGEEVFPFGEYKYATIQEWLCNIFSSKYIVTTSFHGVVFSILFHKPFVWFPLKGTFSRGNARVEELLNELELTNYIWDQNKSLDVIFSSNVDWNKVDRLIEDRREESLAALKNALQYNF